jgi:hypothetical protein
MAKAQITLPDGISVNVSGTPEEIAAVVERFSKTPKERTPPKKIGRAGPPRKKKLELSDLIANLIDGGFFKKPKDLAAVKEALAEMGHHYPVTTLSPTLLRQVRKRNLRRLKQNKRWMYTG